MAENPEHGYRRIEQPPVRGPASAASPEIEVPIYINRCEVATVASWGITLAVEDLTGVEADQVVVEEWVREDPWLALEELQRAQRDLRRAAEQLERWCQANPSSEDADG